MEIAPFPVIFAAAESTAMVTIESWSQITNLWFLIISGTAAVMISVIKAPDSGLMEAAIQKAIQGRSIVAIEGFFNSIVFRAFSSVF